MKAVYNRIRIIAIYTFVIGIYFNTSGQIPINVEKIARSYVIHQVGFINYIDLDRATLKEIQAGLKENAHEIIDSMRLLYIENSSKNHAFSPTTGLTLAQFGKLIKISNIQDANIASKFGMKKDQLIRSINGVYPVSVKHAWELLQNDKSLKLELLNGSVRQTISLQQGQYAMKAIELSVYNRQATIKLNALQKGMRVELTDVLSQIQNINVDTVIIDIRNIFGFGNLKNALILADQCIPENTEVLEVPSGTATYTYTSSGKGELAGFSIKVMIDSTTYGMGLLLAQVLQQYANAEIVGLPSSDDRTLYITQRIQTDLEYHIVLPIKRYQIGEHNINDGRRLYPNTSTDKFNVPIVSTK
jgi:C-terminal processing protease CtpA/Prc